MKHSLRKSLAALALICAAGSAAAVGPSDLGNLTNQTFSIGNTHGNGITFNDIYTFDIMPLSAVAGTAVTINLDIPVFPDPEFLIENFAIAFKDSSGFVIASDAQTSPTDYTVALYWTLPAANDYQFVVSGTATGTLGGSYGGVLQAVAVPEPEAYAMFLAGLGLFGLIARRRTHQV